MENYAVICLGVFERKKNMFVADVIQCIVTKNIIQNNRFETFDPLQFLHLILLSMQNLAFFFVWSGYQTQSTRNSKKKIF